MRALWIVLLVTVGGRAEAGEAAWLTPWRAAQQLFGQAATPADWAQVAAFCEAALELLPPAGRRAEVQFVRGAAWYQAGDPATAVRALRAAVAGDDTRPRYRLWLAYACAADERPTHAWRLLRSVRDDPRADADERQAASDWLTRLGDPPAAGEFEPREVTRVAGAVVRHEPRQPAVGQIAGALAEGRRRLRERLGLDVVDEVEVVLFADQAAYRAAFAARGVDRPAWSTAVSFLGRLFTFAGGDPDRLKTSLIHEYTHLVVRAAADDRGLPVWLDEGLATLLADEFPDHRRELARSPVLLSWEALQVPSFAVYDTASARLAYVQSKGLTAALLRWGGLAKWQQLLRELASAEFAGAFQRVYGSTPREFDAWWRREGLDVD